MREELLQMTKRWMELERKTQEQRKVAERFYDEHLMNLITEDYIERNQDDVLEDVQFLVVSVGTSYEPIVLNIQLFQPEKILFLCTAKTEKTLEKIVKYCGLSVSRFEKSRVSETDPLDIYREIKRIYLEWNKPEKMYIDFTGGTKAMSAAAAMAGALIDVQLIYVGSTDFLTDFRKPNPGSETLYYIDNPVVVFGDLELEKAMVLFREHNYAGAQEKLEILKENIPDPIVRQQLNFVYLLAKTYEAWDALDFEEAFQYIMKLTLQLRRDRRHVNFLLMDYTEKLSSQERVLSYLKEIPELIKEKRNMDILTNKEMICALMFTMYQNAKTREAQEKYDMATLLFYRLLEMIEQRSLSRYNLYVSKMDYMNIKINKKLQPEYCQLSPNERFELLKTSVAEIKKQVFGTVGSHFLPEQISLLEGFIILSALHDPIVKGREKNDIAGLKRIRSMVYLRNNSIFAHGLGPVKPADYSKFRTFVEEVFKRFCKLERISFEDYCNVMEWIDPLKSKNYMFGMEGK